jgi:hypothetical protein
VTDDCAAAVAEYSVMPDITPASSPARRMRGGFSMPLEAAMPIDLLTFLM